jgi:DNA-binding response OmpR family regulator
MIWNNLTPQSSFSENLFGDVLLVEDDAITSHTISYSLKKRNSNVVVATSGESAYKIFMKERFDVCLIDINLLGNLNGINLTKKIRSKNSHIPIILISTDDCVDTKLIGFDAGADDYATKPINPLELMGRISIIKKRMAKNTDLCAKRFKIGDMNFDYDNLLLKQDWIEFRLTELEGMLLRYLCLNPNRLIRREDLLLKVWGKNDKFINRSMDVYVSRIRRYLRSQPHISIETVRGVGIKFNADPNYFTQELEIAL